MIFQFITSYVDRCGNEINRYFMVEPPMPNNPAKFWRDYCLNSINVNFAVSILILKI